MRTRSYFAIMFFIALSPSVKAQRIDLAGEWKCSLLSDKDGKQIENNSITTKEIILPGTTDTNHLGYQPSSKEETTHLTRLFEYRGKAKYEHDVVIPKTWKNSRPTLFLERTKPTQVYLDNVYIGSSNDISTPQRYILPIKKPGLHHITIIVDNASGVPQQIYGNSHAYAEDTQTNWNGIIGQIYIKAENASEDTTNTYNGPTNDCFKDFHADQHHFFANGHMIFLRGKHDACVWPITGHVAMDKPSWAKYMGKLAQYGINHIRFHSWCPPEAAFAVADSIGIYLQPELPFWGDFNAKDTTLMTFLHKEGVNILREYSHHPSFVMLALGNELWGSIEKMKEFTDDFRKIAPKILYTFGSNYYLGYQGIKTGMDYFTTCRIGGEGWGKYNTHTRGSFSYADAYEGGMINHFYPNSSLNFDKACDKATVPVISHETGQFQTYPDFNEIKKYTGVLYPYNMEVFRKRLENAGMLDQAEEFHKASGMWSALLYKADIEMDLRTKNMAGFQLLDIQDYPGQGSAYVGIMDAFMDSKGIVSKEQWSQWCSPVVPLLISDKYCFSNSEHLKANIKVANYSGAHFNNTQVYCQIKQGDKTEYFIVLGGFIREGLDSIGNIDIDLSQFKEPTCLTMELGFLDDTGMTQKGIGYNSYQIWVYPNENHTEQLKKGLIITHKMTDEIGQKLLKGAKVLLMPDSTDFVKDQVGGLFMTDYWNYRMFKTICENNKKAVSPGTLGILTNPEHPIFNYFPTEMHTNWQWFPIIKESHPAILDNMGKEYKPIVQVIDNIERNHKLGLIFEFQIGKGKLLICMSDLEKTTKYPEGRAFYESVLRYMHSDKFCPNTHLSDINALKTMLQQKLENKNMDKLNNISQY